MRLQLLLMWFVTSGGQDSAKRLPDYPTAPSIFSQWPAAWAPSCPLLRKTEPCSAGWSARHSCHGPYGGYLWCSVAPLARSSCARCLPPPGCSCSSLLLHHLPWISGRQYRQVPCQAERLQSVGRSIGQSSWTPARDNYNKFLVRCLFNGNDKINRKHHIFIALDEISERR